MTPITLFQDSNTYQLRSGWNDVTVSAFTDYATHIEPLPERKRLLPLAAWLSTVPTNVLRADISRAAAIVRRCPWLAELPAGDGKPVPSFEHDGVTYVHQGNLLTLPAEQFEALTAVVEAYADEPTGALADLLSVLYCPEGVAQTESVVAQTTQAMQSLPMTKAWPALAFFLSNSVVLANNILSYSQRQAQVSAAIDGLRPLIAAGASGGFLSRTRSALIKRWVTSVERSLNLSSTSNSGAGSGRGKII